MADQPVGVYGGVDTHKEVHVAAAVDQAGRVLGAESFGVDPAGYRRLAEWLGSFGPLVRVGVEGTGSYPESTGVVGVWGWSRPRKRPPDLRRL